MRLRTYQRLAMAEAALLIPDLVASIKADIEKVKAEPKLLDGQMRTNLAETQAIRAKALAPAKKQNVGRNEPCPCGSGVKFKRCCIRKG